MDGEPVLGGALCFFLFLFLCFVLLSVASRQGGHDSDTTVPPLSSKHERGGIPSPPFVWDFLSRRFCFLLQRLFRFVWFPLLLVFVFVRCCPCGGRVAMLAVWTQLPPKDRKEATDRVAMLTVAFGTMPMSASTSSPVVVCLAFCLLGH